MESEDEEELLDEEVDWYAVESLELDELLLDELLLDESSSAPAITST